jgi:hypothetical protein
MQHNILPRLGAASGALFVVLLFVPSSVGGDSKIILVLELIGFLLFIPFLGYLSSLLRAAEGPDGWLAVTAFGAGLVSVAIKLGSLAPGRAAQDFADATATHQALDRMNTVAFMASMLPLGVMMAAVSVVALTRGGLPRALGWLAAVTSPLLLVNGMFVDAEVGPAFLLFLLWTLLASVALTIRPVATRAADAGEPARTR